MAVLKIVFSFIYDDCRRFFGVNNLHRKTFTLTLK